MSAVLQQLAEPTEQWVLIRVTPTPVYVSDAGRFYFKNYRRTGKAHITSGEGAMVKIGRQLKSIHQMVYEAFIGPVPFGLEINHVDGDQSNNTPDNLEVGTHGYNVAHAAATGLMVRTRRGSEVKCLSRMIANGISGRLVEQQRELVSSLRLRGLISDNAHQSVHPFEQTDSDQGRSHTGAPTPSSTTPVPPDAAHSQSADTDGDRGQGGPFQVGESTTNNPSPNGIHQAPDNAADNRKRKAAV